MCTSGYELDQLMYNIGHKEMVCWGRKRCFEVRVIGNNVKWIERSFTRSKCKKTQWNKINKRLQEPLVRVELDQICHQCFPLLITAPAPACLISYSFCLCLSAPLFLATLLAASSHVSPAALCFLIAHTSSSANWHGYLIPKLWLTPCQIVLLPLVNLIAWISAYLLGNKMRFYCPHHCVAFGSLTPILTDQRTPCCTENHS